MKAPCKNCENRRVGCHGKCTTYSLYKDKVDRVRAKKIEEYRLIGYFRERGRKEYGAI